MPPIPPTRFATGGPSGRPARRRAPSRSAEADALARTLAPDRPGPGVRFADYGDSLAAPSKHTAYPARSGPPLLLRFAPDDVGKAGFSGGALGIWLPAEGADPPLDGLSGTFLAHLDAALAWGGFPGFAAIPSRPEAWLAAVRAAVRSA